MRNLIFIILICGLATTACGDDGSSNQSSADDASAYNTERCESGITKCESSVLLTCGADGKFIRTPCESQVCGQDGDIYRCMTQEEYDNIHHSQFTHECEAEWTKCVGSERYVCTADLHWQKAENCASSSMTCRQEGNTAVCIKDDSQDSNLNCTSGMKDCTADGQLKTCIDGKWNTEPCPEDKKCMISGESAAASCIDSICSDPTQCSENPNPIVDPENNNVSVNISIRNNSAEAITILPKFRFVLSTEGTGSEYPYNRTESAIFSEAASITIAGGETQTYKNVEIPGDSKQYIGQHFAKESELYGYANNVLLYDTESVSDTIVPQMIDPTTLFADGASYEIVYDSQNIPPEPQSGNVFVNISIRNNSAEAITILPKFRFVLSTEGTGSEYPYNRTESAIFSEAASITIAGGETQTFKNVEIPGDSKQYIGQHFAKESELYGYANNVLLYDTESVSDTIVPQMIDPTTLFADGASYEIVYDSPNIPAEPQSGNVFVNISIQNISTNAITISPRFRFVLSTEGTGSEYPYNRTESAIFSEAASITIAGGETQTYKNVEIPGDSKQYIGQHFAKQSELNGYPSNILLYDTNFVSDTIVPQMIDPSTLFTNGASYHVIYGSN